MAGLDTRGLADGLAQGLGLGMQINNQERQQRYDEARTQQYARGLDMREQEFAQQQKAHQLEQDKMIAQSGYARLAAGQDLDEQQLEAFKRNPWMAPWHVASDEVGQAIDQARRVMDPNDPADINDAQSLQAVNALFGPRINRGHGAKKRIRAMIPGQNPGTVAIDLDVEDEDGNRYTAPMTRNRGKAGEDDEVMQTDVGDIINQVAGYQQLRGALSPEARQRALAYGRQLGFLPEAAREDRWETVQGPGGSLLQRNTRTGEMSSVVGRAPQRGGTSGYAPTSSMKEAQWLVQQGIAPDIQSAYEMTSQPSRDSSYSRRLDQLKFMSRQISDLDKAIQASKGDTGVGPASQELLNERAELVRRRDQLAQDAWSPGGDRQRGAGEAQLPRGTSGPASRDTGARSTGDFDADAFLNDLGI
ncbi:hypothetical protein [Salinicola sp. DM10]|uniref:hypothetical protein n=1 Tax=Salinicola sp. DM10 TaxID=2815721 RepID=UPI001A8CAA9D|nr:hypothetical protein [Salinicola sp. DM10]MCE3025715.1 hypothetical protein [Salinicola sp. DM10]